MARLHSQAAALSFSDSPTVWRSDAAFFSIKWSMERAASIALGAVGTHIRQPVDPPLDVHEDPLHAADQPDFLPGRVRWVGVLLIEARLRGMRRQTHLLAVDLVESAIKSRGHDPTSARREVPQPDSCTAANSG